MRHNRRSDFEKLLSVPREACPGYPGAGTHRRPGLVGAGLIALLIAVGAGAAGVWLWQPPGSPLATPAASLPARDPIKWALVCDPSDPLSETQAENARRYLLEDLPGQFVRGDHVLVTQLGETVEGPLQILFSGKDPGTPGRCNPLTCSDNGPERRKEEGRRDSEFFVPFKAAVQRCFQPGIRGKTPLVEGLFRLSHHPDFAPTAPNTKRKVVLLTDGLQHMTGSSLYDRVRKTKGSTKQGEFTLYTTEGRRHVARYIAMLQQAEVSVLRIMRPGEEARQDWRAKEWLENYLVESGARPPVQMRELW